MGAGPHARVGLGQIHYAMGAWSSGLRFHRDAAQQLKPLNDSYLTATVDDVCGVSGVNPEGDGTRACNLFSPGHTPGAPAPQQVHGKDRLEVLERHLRERALTDSGVA